MRSPTTPPRPRSPPRRRPSPTPRRGPTPSASPPSSSRAGCRSRCGTRPSRARRARSPTTCGTSSRRRSRRCSPPTCRPSYTIDGGPRRRGRRRRVPPGAVQPRLHRDPAAVVVPHRAPRELGDGRRRPRPLEPRPGPRAGPVPRRASGARARRRRGPAPDAGPARRRGRVRRTRCSPATSARDEVAAVGHSAGGGTVVRFAGDDGVVGYVSLASGAGVGGADDEADTEPHSPRHRQPVRGRAASTGSSRGMR